jgi:hypothetical protein
LVQHIKGLDISKVAQNLVFSCRNEMAEFWYAGAGMNVSLSPVFGKWIATMGIVS